ncbi:DUF2782 domain-containing protein [Dyella sp. ASV21]|uniref:DUF2782 domain-containing protein n=1 Tax=Dyella sp. ASV21 TaxID=2795114 RepID=UPI0018EB80E4|nr:DUF2782 domain-containing protein [Dyella sp. ASV21]
MKSVSLLIALGMAVASPSFAQSASQFPPAPPPPGMNDPGVKAVTPPPTPANAPASKANQPTADNSAPLSQPAGASAPQPRDARGDAPPTVNVRTEGDQTIQEYRRSGQLYMVVVTPKSGIPQTFMVDQKGAWTNAAGEPVKPVMYKVMEWGKGKSADDQDNGGQ